MLGVATGISRLLAFFHSKHNLFVHVQKNQPVTGSLQRIRGWYGSRPKWDANSFGGQVRHVRMTAFHKDQKVEAVFDDGDLRNWYPGVVDAINGDGTFNIRWDYPDGGPAISRIREEDIHSFTPPKRIAELVPGSVHIGTVVEVTSYGLFVDIGATRDGLVHVSCLKQGVKKLDDDVLLGQQVTVSWQIVQDRHAPASCHGQLWVCVGTIPLFKETSNALNETTFLFLCLNYWSLILTHSMFHDVSCHISDRVTSLNPRLNFIEWAFIYIRICISKVKIILWEWHGKGFSPRLRWNPPSMVEWAWRCRKAKDDGLTASNLVVMAWFPLSHAFG